MITCRGYAGDAAEFLPLYRACLAHYGIPPATPEQEERVTGLLDSARHMSCLMAYEGIHALGFATWGLGFPAGADVSLMMKELFVAPDARGKGVGRALMAGLIEIARAEGAIRIDWQTDGTNKAAQAFYAGIGAPAFAKQSYRIGCEQFDSFLAELADRA